MRLIRQTKLYFQEGTSDKVYEVDLCEAGEDEFVVNYRYGKRGARLRQGTKTPFPESLEKAEKIYDRLLQSKLNKGYRESSAEKPAIEPKKSAPAEPNAQRARISEYVSQAASGKPPKNWKLSRLLWRAGELGAAGMTKDLSRIETDGDMDEYALAWALGKTASADAVPRLRELTESESENVRRIATEALLQCLPEEEAKRLTDVLREALPDSIREVLENPDTTADELTQVVKNRLEDGQPPHDYLYLLYAQADFFPAAREAVYRNLRNCPFKAPWFRVVRHIFKAAEFRLDAEMFGLLAWRFEKSDAAFSASYGWAWDPDTRRSINVNQELKKPDSRLGYSAKTRQYLRRRVCRTLQRFGELNDPKSFVTLATGVLMAYDDELDRKAPRKSYDYRWSSETRNLTTVEKRFGPYAGYLPLNYLLYANSSRYTLEAKKTWIAAQDFTPPDEVGQTLPPKREEAFPNLWNQAPDALEHLLQHSRCGGVHEFAVKVWRDNPAFNERASVPFILGLLEKEYRVTQELGIDLAREKFDAAKPNRDLILALSGCALDAARKLAIGWLRQCRSHFAADGSFLAELILIRFDDVHAELRTWLGTARPDPDLLNLIAPKVVSGLLDLDPETDEFAETTARNARETLLLIGGDRLGDVSYEVVRELLKHPLAENRLLGAQFLSLSRTPPEDIPEELWELLLTSETSEVRETGMQLFGKLSDESLLERAEILASFCLSKNDDIRRAARPIVERLASHSAGFAQDMVLQFYPLTLRKESIEGLHDDVYELLAGPLREHLHAIPAESCFRMMESRYAAGQKLGFLILKNYVDLDSVPMRQIAKLAGQDHLEGREFIWNYYRQNLDRIRNEKVDALRIVDSDWEDTRHFAFDFFRENFTENDWTPEILVSLCDSVRGEVQDFGRETITRFFREENGQEYLLKLSQHPATELQTFATNYLERFASGSLDRILELEPYFITVLSQVNRGRVAKERVLHFLETQALRDRDIAVLVVPILTRISATIAVCEKAACIRGLRKISSRWPDLETPLKKVEVPVFTPD